MQICMYLHVHITYTIHLFNLRIRNVLLINLSNSFLFIHLIEIYYEIILISFLHNYQSVLVLEYLQKIMIILNYIIYIE